jgi:hypothetical protein
MVRLTACRACFVVFWTTLADVVAVLYFQMELLTPVSRAISVASAVIDGGVLPNKTAATRSYLNEVEVNELLWQSAAHHPSTMCLPMHSCPRLTTALTFAPTVSETRTYVAFYDFHFALDYVLVSWHAPTCLRPVTVVARRRVQVGSAAGYAVCMVHEALLCSNP